MLNRYWLVAIALLTWTLLGMLVVILAAHFVLNYGQIQNALFFGACLGAVIGLTVGVIGVSPIVSANRISAFRWALVGSMIGAAIAVGLLFGIGDFPKQTQADLSLVLLGPASLALGSLVGLFSAVCLWRFRRSR